MTDNEIIKALECIQPRILTEKERKAIENALDLINRQQATIEKLRKNILKYEDIFVEQQAETERLQKENNAMKSDMKTALEELKEIPALHKSDITYAKSEAIKEFAERFEAYTPNIEGETTMDCVKNAIKQTLKEMVGEQG